MTTHRKEKASDEAVRKEKPPEHGQNRGEDPKIPLINRELPRALKDQLAACVQEGEKLLFAVVGDLDLKGKYGEGALVVTDRRFLVVQADRFREYFFDRVMEISVKRMYRKASIYLESRGGKKRSIFRFTYSVASLCDMAVQYISAVAGGEDPAEQLEIVEATFGKLNRICPKCGRTLLHEGAQCIHCQSKSKVAAKLFKYVKPEMKTLVFCILISMVTTVVALLPPFMTKTIVDEIAEVLSGEDMQRPERAEKLPADNAVELKDVRFAYHDKEVLHGIDLHIAPGTVNALVGPSGS